MNMRYIDFSTNFGSRMLEFQCPWCHDIYILDENLVNESTTHCWKCHKPYLQKFCVTSNPKFIRDAIHRNSFSS